MTLLFEKLPSVLFPSVTWNVYYGIVSLRSRWCSTEILVREESTGFLSIQGLRRRDLFLRCGVATTRLEYSVVVSRCTIEGIADFVFCSGAQYGNIDVNQVLRSSHTMSNHIHDLADNERSRLKELLERSVSNGSLCLCPDLWTDSNRQRSYLGITASFVDDDYQLRNFDLCCHPFPNVGKTAENIILVSLVRRKEMLLNPSNRKWRKLYKDLESLTSARSHSFLIGVRTFSKPWSVFKLTRARLIVWTTSSSTASSLMRRRRRRWRR